MGAGGAARDTAGLAGELIHCRGAAGLAGGSRGCREHRCGGLAGLLGALRGALEDLHGELGTCMEVLKGLQGCWSSPVLGLGFGRCGDLGADGLRWGLRVGRGGLVEPDWWEHPGHILQWPLLGSPGPTAPLHPTSSPAHQAPCSAPPPHLLGTRHFHITLTLHPWAKHCTGSGPEPTARARAAPSPPWPIQGRCQQSWSSAPPTIRDHVGPAPLQTPQGLSQLQPHSTSGT